MDKTFTNAIISVFISLFSTACAVNQKIVETEKTAVNNVLDHWHKDAATYRYTSYFEAMSENSVFVGTDTKEVWNKMEFEKFSKPYFDIEKTWDFRPMERNIYFDKDLKTAWFDELLDTWMGICRGSGVLMKSENTWKIEHYVLSVTIPNDNIKKVIEINKPANDTILKKYPLKK